MSADEEFLGVFFRAMQDGPLAPGDERYVPLPEREALDVDDPVELLSRRMRRASNGTAQLLSGYRGTGKSTQLLRLAERTTSTGLPTFRVDVEDYLDTSTPVDVSDFLMVVAGAFSDAVRASGLADDAVPSGWDRLREFFRGIRLGDGEVSAGLFGAGLRANLRSDPSFRKWLQEQMAGHLGALVDTVRAFVEELVAAVQEATGAAGVVLLVDSVEHIRGTGSRDNEAVQNSVAELFSAHAERLHLVGEQVPLHVVYTVPTYLRVLHPSVDSGYSGRHRAPLPGEDHAAGQPAGVRTGCPGVA